MTPDDFEQMKNLTHYEVVCAHKRMAHFIAQGHAMLLFGVIAATHLVLMYAGFPTRFHVAGLICIVMASACAYIAWMFATVTREGWTALFSLVSALWAMASLAMLIYIIWQ